MRCIPLAGRIGGLILALTIAKTASAQTADDKAAAEVLFEQGKAALAEGRLAEACPKLAESLRLDVGTGTMLYLAECYERSGKTASAWAQFREAQSSAARDRDPREKVARERADALEPKLSRLAIIVAPESRIEGLSITRDNTQVTATLWGVETPVDPGKHVVRASAPNHDPWEATIEIGAAGAHEKLVVPPLRRSASTPSGALADRPDPARSDGSTQRTIGYGLMGLGVVGLAVGTFFGVRALGTLEDADRHCEGRLCDPEGLDLYDDSKTQANISTVVFIASAAVLAGGVVLWLTAPSAKSAARTRPAMMGVRF